MIDRRAVLASAALLAGGSAWSAPRKAPAPQDLSGTWTNAWYTNLQRPKTFKGLVATAAEAEAYEAPRRGLAGELPSAADGLGQNESEFPDQGPGLARIRGQVRTSWIYDPPDGRIPWTKAGLAMMGYDKPLPDRFDNVEDRDTDERCLTAPGAGAPLINSHDANLIQIVQTPDAVVIVGEKNHQARIVRIGGAGAPEPVSWMGDSVGRWEGATLVVETTGLRLGFTRLHDVLSLSEHSRVTERFTRTGPAEITYGFTVSDPTLFTRTWRAEMVFRPAEGRLFEYACHEGNYSLPTILRAARLGKQGGAGEAGK